MKIIIVPKNALIRYGALWDGHSPALSGPGVLYIENRLIAESVTDGKTKDVTDLSAYTVMPSLADCHVHLSFAGEQEEQWPRIADLYLASGITAVRDAGSPKGDIFSHPLLTVIPTGQAIYKKGYYGTNLGVAVSDADEAERHIVRLAEKGARQIKIIASGIFSFSQYGKTGPLPFTQEELRKITRRATAEGLRVMAHASGDDAVRLCLKAGVGSVEHGYFVSEDTVRELAVSGIPWIPTLVPVAAQLENETLHARLSEKQRDIVRRSHQRHMEMVGHGYACGARIGAGTDAGAPGTAHGQSLHRELSLLMECGLPPESALRAAAGEAASICGLTQRGFIQHGMKPYLMAVAGNPLHQHLLPDILLFPDPS